MKSSAFPIRLLLCGFLAACSRPQGATVAVSVSSESAVEPSPTEASSSTEGLRAGGRGGTVKTLSAGTFSPLCDDEETWCSDALRVFELIEAGEPAQAGSAFESSKLRNSDIWEELSLYLQGRIALESGPLSYGAGGAGAESARVLFARALAGPSSNDLRDRLTFQLARVQLVLGQGVEALPALRRLADAYPNEAEVHAALGIAYLGVGRVPASLEPLRRASRLAPQQVQHHLVLGTAQMLLGNYAEAERSFRSAIAQSPDLAAAHGGLGSLLLLSGKVEEGEAHLRRAHQLQPQHATYLANLAYAALLLERPEECERLAREATELEPALASGWLNWGLCQVALGDRKKARSSFERAASLDPTDPRPKNNLADLDELEGRGRESAEAAP